MDKIYRGEDMVDYGTINNEADLMTAFESIVNPKPRKVKALALKLFNDAKFDIQRDLCWEIYNAKDPVAHMKRRFAEIRDFVILHKQFLEDGYHGMIRTGKLLNDIYPIKLDTRENWLTEGKQWDPEQEMHIQLQCAENWLAEHKKASFKGEVILFPQFGFSGAPRAVDMRAGNVDGLVKYPGTDYYVKPGLVNQVGRFDEVRQALMEGPKGTVAGSTPIKGTESLVDSLSITRKVD